MRAQDASRSPKPSTDDGLSLDDPASRRVHAAGGLVTSAVIHYKPGRSRVALEPDHYAALAHGWVTYPYKAGS